jgi:5-carboxymethyl-2-hydroxymuconate isomerase
MRLARFTHRSMTTWGFVDGEELRAAPAGAPGLTQALTAGGEVLTDLRAAAGPPVPLAEARLLAPIERPSKVVCVGLNYGEHAREAGLAIPTEPLLFAKFPSAICGPADDVRLPAPARLVDWEAELGVVIGSRIEQVSPEHALEHVAGYLVANDVTARDLQGSDGQWVRSKSFTSFCPLGPWVTTRDEVGDGSGLTVRLTVNGVVKQHGNTSDLIFGVAELVSFCSQVSAWEPGDVLLTGTPAGTGFGMKPREFLSEGDHMETSISGLGGLSNRVVRADQSNADGV